MSLFAELEKKIIKKPAGNVVSITGGGGKTSFMTEFGSYLRASGYSVLLTTTTKIAGPKNHDYKTDDIFDSESILGYESRKGRSALYAERSFDVKKWCSPRLEILSILVPRFDVILIEADGSRGLPIKYHTERDPVIISETDAVIGIVGLWAIGNKAYEVAFGDGRDITVDKSYIESYLDDSEGIAKGMSPSSYNAVLFNGADINPEFYSEFVHSLNKRSLYEMMAVSVIEDSLYV